MARAAPTGWSTANHLIRAGFVKDGDALLMHAWANFPAQADACVMSQGQAGTLNHHRNLRLRAAATGFRSTAQQTAAAGTANGPTGASINTWTSAGSYFATSTSRYSYRGTARGTENTTSVVPETPNELLIGLRHDDSEVWSSTGSIASPSVWDFAGLTVTDVDALMVELATLVDGLARNPLLINLDSGAAWEGKLLAYWDLDVNSATFGNDLTGNGHHLTEVGTLTAFGSFAPVAAAEATCATTGTILPVDYVPESEIVTGGLTIILTLSNDTWDATVGADNAITTALLDGIAAATSPAGGWNDQVRAALTFAHVVRTSNTVVTITLPAVAGYNLGTTQEAITITIPASALVTSASALISDPGLVVQPVIATTRRSATTWTSDTNYLKTNTVFLPTRYKYLFSAWKQRTDAIKGTVYGIGVEGFIENLEKCFNSIGDQESWVSTLDGISKPQASVTGTPQNRWYHIAALPDAVAARYVWARGTLEDVNTGDQTGLAAADVMLLGERPDKGEGGPLTFAEPSWWDVSAMTLTEIRALVLKLATLVNGLAPNPLAVNAEVGQPWSGKLYAAIDLDFTSPTFGQDLSGNDHHFTLVGSGLTEFSSYPPVAEAAGSSGRLMMMGVG